MSSARFEMKCFVYIFVEYCVRTKTNKIYVYAKGNDVAGHHHHH